MFIFVHQFEHKIFKAVSLDTGNLLLGFCEIYKENLTSQIICYVGKAISRWQLWVIFVEQLEKWEAWLSLSCQVMSMFLLFLEG